MISSGDCARVCALVFGKEEDGGGFDFSQDSIDATVNYCLQGFSGGLAPFNPLLPPHFFRIWVPLTISDKYKHLLMQSPDLTKMLIEGLLLDPEHIRQSQDPAIRHRSSAMQLSASRNLRCLSQPETCYVMTLWCWMRCVCWSARRPQRRPSSPQKGR